MKSSGIRKQTVNYKGHQTTLCPSFRPVFFGIDGTKEGLEAVKDGTLAATVYNDKEGQAAAMANLAFSIATEDENNPNPFKNYKYIYRAYQKVTKENVQTFLEKEE